MMSYVALGANLPSDRFGPPRATLHAAIAQLRQRGLTVGARSSWYASAPVPASDQPWFINAVVRLDDVLEPAWLLETLHALEAALGRVRSVRNAPRAVDLDLIDAGGRVSAPDDWPVLPHPRLHARAFVLMPLKEVAPDWRDPRSGTHIDALLAALPPGQTCRRAADGEPPES
ncbi:2-amino-4-hydroxy-6-hydroxymethyldihydropteridine diphosphokinase [Rhodovibrio sodomensis]|uniref:2-amino-4-hydroxy-6-hydroxymethyldihydropteridine pyrophosphokinase n=1 Tax=Rhodovibrio sodomensis TaxID=1088 RepID=A0ABS1DC69_9PROT|nr:2-amino-4-hydroxy-6-hydroxymethyldihydropteridine diphosphokinase [Rhodovibrio sodomensis]MBK1668068.1 2-amino-4-hydroxy-6-hydroxymethyldihydropteridine diphosphokinase [Rhodovibrio sodomensis]